jgi:hypothetical protein
MSGRYRWLVALTALVAVVGVAAFVALSRPASVAPSPSSSIEARTAADFLWTYTEPLLPPNGGPPRSYSLQGGTLADAGPVLDVEVPWVIGGRPSEGARRPAVSLPVAGGVVYVADDGRRSTVHRVSLTDSTEGEPIGALDAEVWTLAAAPNGSAAFLLMLDRGTGADRGVVRLALDGSGTLTPVLDPAGVPMGAAGMRLAATVNQLSLAVAVDGSHLVRRSCGVDGTCALDVVDLATMRVTRLADREVMGVGGGYLLSMDCTEVDCQLVATDLSTGADLPMTGIEADAFLTVAGDRMVIIHSEWAPGGNPTAVLATDLVSGETARIIEADGAGALVHAHNPAALIDLKLVPPDGWILVDRFRPEGGPDSLGLPLDGGPSISLGPAPFRPIAQPGTNG